MEQQVRLRPAYALNSLCQEFDISRSTAYAEIKAGRLRAFKLGDKTMVAGEDAAAWLASYRRVARPLAA